MTRDGVVSERGSPLSEITMQDEEHWVETIVARCIFTRKTLTKSKSFEGQEREGVV